MKMKERPSRVFSSFSSFSHEFVHGGAVRWEKGEVNTEEMFAKLGVVSCLGEQREFCGIYIYKLSWISGLWPNFLFCLNDL